MASTVTKLRPAVISDPVMTQSIGQVESLVEGRYAVPQATGILRCSRATSCLIAPALGDTVLLATDGDRAWIIAVLERVEAGPLAIESEQDIVIKSGAGKLSLQAAQGISIASDARLELQADALQLRAREGNILVEQLTWLGKSALAHLGRVEWVGNMLEAVSERMRITTRQSFREVEGLEQVRAGMLDQRVEGTATLHADNTIISARELVKLDGGQVHLG